MPPITNSVISYPDRGHWGNREWRGNCSGYVMKDLIETYSPRLFVDPMEGSGTSREVCAELGTPYLGYDIKDGYDILNHKTQWKILNEIKAESDGDGADLIFLHPPYWSMIKYSQNPMDFCNGTYETYLNRMNSTLGFLKQCLSDKGRIVLLLADLRTRNSTRTFFLTDDITEHEKLFKLRLHKEIRIIKIQHNTMSGGVNSTGVSLAHEYLTIIGNHKEYRGVPDAELTEPAIELGLESV